MACATHQCIFSHGPESMISARVRSAALLGAALVLLTISLAARPVDGANILGLFTSHSPSHLIVHMSVAKALAERGHNVTVVSTVKPTVTHDSIRHIIIPPSEERENARTALMTNVATDTKMNVNAFKNWWNTISLWLNIQFDAMKDARFQALYEDTTTKFDLVILGAFLNDYQLGVAAKFKCPVIMSWVGAPMEMVNTFVGNPAEPSYVPNMNVGAKVGEIMSFVQRLQNLFTELFLNVYSAVLDYRMQQIYEELFAKHNLPTYSDMKKNVSLVFCNSHFSEGPVRPNVPAIVEIGGIQIKEKADLLPKHIAEFLQASAQNGAILLSLGSNLHATNIKPEIIDTLFKTLSSLKQNVIWKWEDLDKTPGNASNILYQRWLPQDDILAHPNLKLFITHAGKGSITESQYHGVPMLALPLYADQPGNAKKMVASGYGLQLDMLQLSEAHFKATLNVVLNNSSYTNNVRKFSQLYRDRALSPKEAVVFWSEYVIRHHGAALVQSPVLQMNFIERWNLDVMLLLRLTLYLIWRLLKIIYRYSAARMSKKFGKSSVKVDAVKKTK